MWYCPYCEEEVLPQHVTSEEKHDPRFGGCGYPVKEKQDITHKHIWETRYVTIRGVDCASGMTCKCGAILEQDAVEGIINAIHQPDNAPRIKDLERRMTYIEQRLGINFTDFVREIRAEMLKQIRRRNQ